MASPEDLAKITTPSFPSAFIGNPVSQIQHDMDYRLRGNDGSWAESLILQEAHLSNKRRRSQD